MIKIRRNNKISYTAIDSFLPRVVTVPLRQENFDNCQLNVAVGAYVKEGQVIAQDPDVLKNPLAAAIHSPVPGVVQSIEKITLHDGRESQTVKIKMQGTFSFRGKDRSSFNWKNKTPSEIIQMISNYGVINTFFINKQSSLAPQIKNRNPESSRIIIVRLFDEDPFRCTDSFLAENYFNKIKQGAAVLAYALQANGIVFAYDKNWLTDKKGKKTEDDKQPDDNEKLDDEKKSEADKNCFNLENTELDERLFNGLPVKYLPVDCKKYPAGLQRILIDQILKSSVENDLFSRVNIYDLMTDSVTLVHLYEAVCEQVPVISQYVYVYGDCLKVSGILRVPIGIPLNFIVDECGGFLKKPANIIINGQLSGWKAVSDDYPITKNIKSVAFVSSVPFPDLTPNECIRCGKCRMVCPAGLCPDVLFNQIITKNENVDQLFIKSSALCTSCALCNSVCSARLPLSQVIEIIRGHSYEKQFS